MLKFIFDLRNRTRNKSSVDWLFQTCLMSFSEPLMNKNNNFNDMIPLKKQRYKDLYCLVLMKPWKWILRFLFLKPHLYPVSSLNVYCNWFVWIKLIQDKYSTLSEMSCENLLYWSSLENEHISFKGAIRSFGEKTF